MIKKTDSNQAEIVRQIRKLGCSVVSIHTVGKGVPDLLIGVRGKNILCEVKDPSKSPSQRKLTKDEQNFFDTWQGQVSIVTSIDDFLKLIE